MKKVAHRNSQSNTVSIDKSKKVSNFYESYSDFKIKPFSERSLRELIAEFLDWCVNNQKAYKASQFFTLKGLAYKTVQELRRKYEWFDEGYLFGLEIIGCRRECGAIEKILSEGMVKYTQHRYDPEWKEIDEYNAKLKITNVTDEKQIVEIEEIRIPKGEQ